MSRINGQLTWITPTSAAAATSKAVGDLTTTAGVVRAFFANERVTVVEVGVIAIDSTNVPSNAFTFRVKKRTGALIANDAIISVFKSTFAAEGGVAGDPSISGFDEGNKISAGLITNAAAGLTAGKCLRAFCEVSLDKGDALCFEVVGTSAAGAVAFYAKAYPMGAGLVEGNDVESN